MDWMEQEQERGITITSAATTCDVGRPHDQHHRHPRPRRLHRRGRALAARPRRRRRGVRRRRRRRAAVRDGLAPGRPLPRPADLLRQQAGPHRRGVPPLRRHDRHAAATRSRWSLQIPIGAEARLHAASSTWSRMKALVWRGETDKGEMYDDRRDPGRRTPRPPASGATGCSRPSPRTTTTMMELYLEGEEPTEDAAHRRDPPRDHRRQAHPGAVRLGVQEQGRPAHARRRRPLPAVAARRRRHRGPRRRRRGRVVVERQPTRDRAVLRAGLQDHDRPAPRQAHLHPGLLRHARDRHRRCSTAPRAARSGSARSTRCTPTSARRSPVGGRRPHRRRDGSEGHHHRRHALRPGRTRSSSSR